jgi:hypothetical protein
MTRRTKYALSPQNVRRTDPSDGAAHEIPPGPGFPSMRGLTFDA